MTEKTAKQIVKEMVSVASEAEKRSGEGGVFVEFSKAAILEIGIGQRYSARLEKDLATEFESLGVRVVQSSDGFGVFSTANVPVMTYRDVQKLINEDE